MARLTPEDVIEIRKRSHNGESIEELSEAFQMTFTHMWAIVKRKAWKTARVQQFQKKPQKHVKPKEKPYNPWNYQTELRVTTPEEAEAFRKKAWWIACHRGYEYLADDFASDAVIRWLQGRKAQVSHLLVDFLDNEYINRRYGYEVVSLSNLSNNIDTCGVFHHSNKKTVNE